MARRLFRGRAFSENGWPYVDQGSCTWIKVPGAEHVSLQIQNGPPLAILRAFAADFHAHVEPLRDADSACWTADNTVDTSNHPGGTSMDLNWNGADGRTFRYGISEAQAYPGPKAQAVRDLIDFYEGTVFCGGSWSIRDWMHFQLGGNTYDQASDRPKQKVLDFIARKIRADGFSTYKRGGTTNPPVVDAAQILSEAMGNRLSLDRYRQLLPAVSEALRACECTNVNRVAMWCAQIGHESGGLFYTEEIASGSAYEGRADLGNTQPGDGVRFKGRSWIQITGRSNYTRLSQWAHGKGLVPTPTYFVDNPAALASDQYAGLGAAWYWVVARSDINALSDARNIELVSRRINGTNPNTGRANGIEDRIARHNRALAMGDRLLALTRPPTPVDPLEELLMSEPVDSWSIYATPGEPKIPPINLWRAIDAYCHRKLTDEDAKDGDLVAVARVARTARGEGTNRSAGAIAHATRVLDEIERDNPEILQRYLRGPL